MRPAGPLNLLEGVKGQGTDVSPQLDLDTDITVQILGALGVHVAIILTDEVSGLLPAEVGNLEQLEQDVKFYGAERDRLRLKRRTRLEAQLEGFWHFSMWNEYIDDPSGWPVDPGKHERPVGIVKLTTQTV